MLPDDILALLSHMESHGIKGYVVGGAVRDLVMGREPDDYDIAAECLPEDLLEAFSDHQHYDTSIRFGTLNVYSGKRWIEITCCRYESGYSDLRHPDTVEFCKDIKKDLKERLQEIVEYRKKIVPTMPSAGCVFKNPVGYSAGRLIEEANLKGYSIGGAMVSPKHANIIINCGRATSGDIKALINHIKSEINRLYDI